MVLKPFKLFLPLLIILLLILTFFLIRSNIFTIKTVDVRLEKIACGDSNQIKDSSKALGQNFFLINSAKIESDLKKNYLCIKAVKISRYFPNKIKLQVFGREPYVILVVLKTEEATSSATLNQFIEASGSAIISFEQGEIENFVIDGEGIIYSQNIDQINIPKIYFPDDIKVESDLLKDVLKILERVKTFDLDTKEVKIYQRSILLVNAMPRVIFKLDANIDTQLASLQLILAQAKIDEANLEFIDLRFDKPIVRLAPKKNG